MKDKRYAKRKRVSRILLNYIIYALFTVCTLLVGFVILAHNSLLMQLPVNHPYHNLQVNTMQKKVPLPQYLDQYASPVTFHLEQPSDPRQMWIETTSWRPRAYIIHNLLSDEECDHLIRVANASLKTSKVTERDENGKMIGVKDNNIRTSSGTFLARYKDGIIGGIEERVALMTGVPLENGEDMQILKYEKGQHYQPHHDSFMDVIKDDGFQRTVTCLMYLSDPEGGGETNFPDGIPTQDFKEQHQNDMLSTCASQHAAYSVKPKRGDALVFHSLDVSNQYDDMYSKHQGCDVLQGIKWSSTIWMHQEAFRIGTLYHRKMGLCMDGHEQCSAWAKVGECSKNPQYMLEGCSKSCGVC